MESLSMMRYSSLSSSLSLYSIPSSSSSFRKTHNIFNNNKLIFSCSATLKEEDKEEKSVVESVSNTIKNNGSMDLLELTARERRQLRNERREHNVSNWREEMEEKLMTEKKPKKRYATWKEELNLDKLSDLGPQWWIVRTPRAATAAALETPDVLARVLSRNYPHIDFKVYAPAVRVKKKWKDGTISVKQKPVFPGCVFLRSILNKELHDFIIECPGVYGFIGSTVGNMKRQINRPKPVSSHDIEAIFRHAKEEQDRIDKAFEEEMQREAFPNEGNLTSNSKDVTESSADAKPKRRLKKDVKPLGANASPVKDNKRLIRGSNVRVMSGPFMEFIGTIKKLHPRSGQATVGFMLFGQESLVKMDIDQIVVETS